MDQLASLGVRLLETFFFLGLIGSSGVVVLSFVEDLRELFESDEHV